MSEKKTIIVFSQEPRLENNQVLTSESKRLIDKYPDKYHHGVI